MYCFGFYWQITFSFLKCIRKCKRWRRSTIPNFSLRNGFYSGINLRLFVLFDLWFVTNSVISQIKLCKMGFKLMSQVVNLHDSLSLSLESVSKVFRWFRKHTHTKREWSNVILYKKQKRETATLNWTFL